MNNNFMPPYGSNYGTYNGNNNYNGNYNRVNTFAYVNGYTGAQAYIVPPNSTTVLLDSEKPMLYIKNADMYGRAELKAYEYKEYKEPTTANVPTDYVTRKEFEELKKELTGALNEQFSANNAANEQRQPTADSQSNVAK